MAMNDGEKRGDRHIDLSCPVLLGMRFGFISFVSFGEAFCKKSDEIKVIQPDN